MSGMPVDRYAVARSPQGIDIAVRGLSAKGISRTNAAGGTLISFPPRRTRPPLGALSSAVLSVPGLERPRVAKARPSEGAWGTLPLSRDRRQALGPTANAGPGGGPP